MPDSMQNEAMERLKQMYSKAQPGSSTAPQNAGKHIKADTDTAPQEPTKNEPQLHNDRRENLLDILMQDKEKSLIVLLIVLLISEKADSTLILALMYLIL